MAKDPDAEKLDDDTLEQLDQVRKGKPRRFVMICKGASVISLVVYKKGNLEKYKKQAKEGGKGQIYYGVVDGRGPEINFKLSREDGFTKEPVKTSSLRTFLEEQADYKAKPLFEIIEAHGPCLDPDDPLVQRFMKLQQAAIEACDTHPDAAPGINADCLAIGKTIEADQPKEAEEKLVALEQLLQSLSGPPTGGDASTTPTADPKLLEELTAELKRLQPEVEVLLKANIGDTGMLRQTLTEVAAYKQQGNLEAALDGCRKIADYLRQDWEQRRREAETRVDAVLIGDFTQRAGDVEKIKTVFGFANERAGDGRYGSALVALKNLGTLLTAAEAPDATKESDVIAEGTVESRKKFVESRWQATMRGVSLEVDKLRAAISIAVADEPPNELADMIQVYIDDFCDEINDAILNVGDAGPEDKKPVEKALDLIKDYRSRIATDEMFQHLNDARNALDIDIDAQSKLLEALSEIEGRLSEPVGA